MSAPVAEKINVIDYVPLKKLPLLKRIVKWYRDTPIIPKFVKAGVAYGGPTILGILSLGLLLPFIFKIKDYSYQLELEAANNSFQTAIQSKISKGEISPPSDAPIALKSDKQTFNHVNDYVIKDGILWYRRHMGSPKDKAWKPLFFDGAMPMKISADGANLTVVDSAEKVHYRKVLIEARGYDEIHRRRLERHLNNSALKNNFNAKEDKDTYVAIDKTEKANWKEKWYSLPILNRIVNFFTGNRLTVHGQMAHSHRGRFDEAYSDVEGNLHQASIGVTTSYELETDGTGIIKHDPWVTTLARVHFYFPETNDTAYVAKKLDASGSSLLAVGYTVDRKSGQGKLKILSNLCDIDILGGNPLLNYAYHTEHTTKENMHKKNLRVLPDQVKNEGWIDETLPEGAMEFYNQIAILQERRGKRELRIAAKDQNGALGYYHKVMKSNDKWEFTPHEGIDQSQPLPLTTQIQQTLQKGPGHYEGTIKNKKASAAIEIDHFGERAYHSDVKMKLDGQDYNLALHRRWGWQTFFGGKRDRYELVVPDTSSPENNRKVAAFFGGRRVIPVKIQTTNEKNEERVTITPK
jgi:hypothetical protein